MAIKAKKSVISAKVKKRVSANISGSLNGIAEGKNSRVVNAECVVQLQRKQIKLWKKARKRLKAGMRSRLKGGNYD